MVDVEIPNQFELMWPMLQALKQLGGSGRIDEIVEAVIDAEGFTEAQEEVRRKPGDRMSRIEYYLAWARNGLKNIGAIENSSRGVWAITDLGRGLNEAEALGRVKAWRAEYSRRYHEARRQAPPEDELDEVEPDVEREWKDVLIERLMKMPPDAFERSASASSGGSCSKDGGECDGHQHHVSPRTCDRGPAREPHSNFQVPDGTDQSLHRRPARGAI